MIKWYNIKETVTVTLPTNGKLIINSKLAKVTLNSVPPVSKVVRNDILAISQSATVPTITVVPWADTLILGEETAIVPTPAEEVIPVAVRINNKQVAASIILLASPLSPKKFIAGDELFFAGGLKAAAPAAMPPPGIPPVPFPTGVAGIYFAEMYCDFVNSPAMAADDVITVTFSTSATPTLGFSILLRASALMAALTGFFDGVGMRFIAPVGLQVAVGLPALTAGTWNFNWIVAGSDAPNPVPGFMGYAAPEDTLFCSTSKGYIAQQVARMQQ